MDRQWWKKAVVYQVYPRSFKDSNGDGVGDLNGITEKLPYIKRLGADVIWLSPVYRSPNDDNGYDISDYRNIMTEFGTLEDFDRMLHTAHDLGLKIMMDLVVNHTSDEHPWFQESRKSEDNPYRDYYIWRKPKADDSAPNNWGSVFSGPAWEMDARTGMYYLHLFSVKQPDLNWDNPRVRDEVFDMMNWWLKKGVDGFRMDVICCISKPEGLPDGIPEWNGYADADICANGPHIHEYLQEMRKKVLDNGNLITVGECSGVSSEEAIRYAGLDGKELNMIFQFEHVNLDRVPGAGFQIRKVPLTELKTVLGKWQKVLAGRAWNSLYWCNHDQPRIVSRLGDDSPEYRELSAKMLATCLHMMQGTPYIYQGEELGMTNGVFKGLDDFRDLGGIKNAREFMEQGGTEEEALAYLRKKGRDNSRTPMQWNTEKNAGFSKGNPWISVNPNYTAVNAEEQENRKDSVFHYYQELIRLRHTEAVITDGTYRSMMDSSETVFAYARETEKEGILVLCNFGKEAEKAEIPEEYRNGEILIGNYPDRNPEGPELLRPYEALVLKKTEAAWQS